eukprot:62458-Prorocentrum_minimum.AAC.1
MHAPDEAVFIYTRSFSLKPLTRKVFLFIRTENSRKTKSDKTSHPPTPPPRSGSAWRRPVGGGGGGGGDAAAAPPALRRDGVPRPVA